MEKENQPLDQSFDTKPAPAPRNTPEDSPSDRFSLAMGIAMAFVAGTYLLEGGPIWIGISCLVSAACGYFVRPSTPITSIFAGIVFGICGTITMPWYFAGRSRFMRLEILIPAFVALIPAFIVYFIGGKLADNDDE